MPKTTKAAKVPQFENIPHVPEDIDLTIINDKGTEIIDEKTGKKKSGSKYRYYLFTFNNYHKYDYQKAIFDKLRDIVEWAIINYEIAPTTGTKHLQGAVCLKDPIRLISFVGLFPVGIWARNAWHVPKVINYCRKETTRDPEHDTLIMGNVPDPQKITEKGIPKPEKIKPEEVKTIEHLRNWQKTIETLFIDKEAGDREPIHWFYSSKGKIGKTALLRYLWKHHPNSTIYLRDASDNDIFNHLLNSYNSGMLNSKTTLLINVPREKGNKINYNMLESIKDGLLFNSKYETQQALFNPPHIVIMANAPPLMETLSIDRLKVYEIDFKNDKLNDISTIDNIINVYDCDHQRVKFYVDNIDKIDTAESDLIKYLKQCGKNDLCNRDSWELYQHEQNKANKKQKAKMTLCMDDDIDML